MLLTLPLLRLLPDDLNSLSGHPHTERGSEEGAPLLEEGPSPRGARGDVELSEPTASKRGHTP